jgi:hypothetical protein
MVPHPYLSEKLVATRQAEIKHEIQRNRMKAHEGRRRTLFRSAAGRIGTFMIVLGSYLLRTGQRSGVSIHSS